MKTPSWLSPLEMQAHFRCTAWHFLSKIKKNLAFCPSQALALKCSMCLSKTERTDISRHLVMPLCVRESWSSLALVRQCPAPTPPSLYSSPALAHQEYDSTPPNPAPEWPNDQKSHLWGGPTKAQGFLRWSISPARLDPTLLELASEHCWNPGAGSYVCFCISFLSFTPYSNSLFLEHFE